MGSPSTFLPPSFLLFVLAAASSMSEASIYGGLAYPHTVGVLAGTVLSVRLLPPHLRCSHFADLVTQVMLLMEIGESVMSVKKRSPATNTIQMVFAVSSIALLSLDWFVRHLSHC